MGESVPPDCAPAGIRRTGWPGSPVTGRAGPGRLRLRLQTGNRVGRGRRPRPLCGGFSTTRSRAGRGNHRRGTRQFVLTPDGSTVMRRGCIGVRSGARGVMFARVLHRCTGTFGGRDQGRLLGGKRGALRGFRGRNFGECRCRRREEPDGQCWRLEPAAGSRRIDAQNRHRMQCTGNDQGDAEPEFRAGTWPACLTSFLLRTPMHSSCAAVPPPADLTYGQVRRRRPPVRATTQDGGYQRGVTPRAPRLSLSLRGVPPRAPRLRLSLRGVPPRAPRLRALPSRRKLVTDAG